MRRLLILLGVTLGAIGFSMMPASAADDAHVSVLHGIPEAVVDVYANGDELLTNFEPGTLTDPVSLPAGDYDLKVVAAGDGADGDAIVEANGVAVPGGANITVVANLDADGNPALTPFVNDTSKIAAGDGRLTVRHVAAAPAVDVRANGEPAFTDLTNPNEDTADLPAGTVSADVVLAGTEDVVIGPADVDVAEGVSTIVYAWGSAQDDNLQLAVQTIDGMHSSPGSVPGGSGGQAADGLMFGSAVGWIVAGTLIAGGLAALLTRTPVPRRQQ
ncbi:DUF4397 domain-containing protein [Mumia zhuanghuii]|uniref:DUF4397 domain-containing protein n=2 Tax=Mumia TaxID=1546255 RepID=A0ABW1QHH4_9ACTN|nr:MULTISPECIES: DUF4397 domain-containing protein [Mumia]KAA1418153.1 DUF4397 domain-containing protein [Mumia zhuanghuii]